MKTTPMDLIMNIDFIEATLFTDKDTAFFGLTRGLEKFFFKTTLCRKTMG